MISSKTNFSEDKLPGLNCIGSIPPLEVLNMAGFYMASNDSGQVSMPQFNNKTIIDFGAGISDFSNLICQLSSPRRIAAIDVMYQNDEFYNAMLEKTRYYVAHQIEEYISIKKNTYLISDSTGQGEIRDVGNNFKRMVKLLRQDQHHNTGIEKYTSINGMNAVEQCDFIFATHILYHFSDRFYLLALLGTMLNDEGKIYIIDYDIEGNSVTECIEMLRNQVKLGNTGIKEIGSLHGNTCFEITKRGAIEAYQIELS